MFGAIIEPFMLNPRLFTTAADAWAFLRDERASDEDATKAEGAPYSDTHRELSEIAVVALLVDPNRTGTIHGPTPGYEGSGPDLGLTYRVFLPEEEANLLARGIEVPDGEEQT